MNQYSSEFGSNEVQNSPSDAKVFNRKNVFWVKIINRTAFEVIVGDRIAGDIRIPAGESVQFWGHPNWPTELNYKVQFNGAALPTDFITILTSQTNGQRFKEC